MFRLWSLEVIVKHTSVAQTRMAQNAHCGELDYDNLTRAGVPAPRVSRAACALHVEDCSECTLLVVVVP